MISLRDQIFNYKNIIIFSLHKKSLFTAIRRSLNFFYKLIVFIFKIFFINKKIQNFSSTSKQLNEIFVYFGTNKGSHLFINNVKHQGHGYDIFYEKYFKVNRDKKINILEFGIHNGDSLAALHCYFPNSNIIGVDRNPFSSNYKSKRIRNLYCDVSSIRNLENLSSYLNNDYDYIIDDASHDPIHQKLTFFSMFKNLRSGGIFIIEEFNAFQAESGKDDAEKNFLRNLFLDTSKYSEKELKAKYGLEIFNFFENVQNIEINKGAYSHRGVNISEIAFIKKK